MGLTFEHPPTSLPGFLEERFTAEEWFRRFKAPGRRYQFGHHYGYDLQDRGTRLIYPGVSGRVRYVDHGPDLGVQLLIVPDQNPALTLLHSHLAKRVAPNGAHVDADEVVAVMGATGNASGVHTHFTGLIDNTWGRFWNPGPDLTRLQEGYMPLNAEDKTWIRDLIRKEVGDGLRELLFFLQNGAVTAGSQYVPGPDTGTDWNARKNLTIAGVIDEVRKP